ncbi:50S ribosomal protein L24 [Buchnera aphidicola]|uniref:Large ribosomal subunit protein uL24 n=1 Tax=Buchnera aphidicola (Anoecia oenotherae) TaxID=1241833 RepID=A0A4D6XR75_9GAMM|nr:50S ribosomal protein L24 [Buchnera aphidicola]QCI19513.1 50S ribosomal protein L24 [Buchnera aphidicola (Anoecia oenotherae)]
MAAKIRKNDTVMILSGRDKGKVGKVIGIKSDSNKVMVKGINIVTKHQKSVPSQNKSGGIIKQEAYIHISNVGVLNKKTGKSEKIGFKFQSGKKFRFFKSSNEILI